MPDYSFVIYAIRNRPILFILRAKICLFRKLKQADFTLAKEATIKERHRTKAVVLFCELNSYTTFGRTIE